jgi:ABC-type Zn uptake system ZnuABC Zn-binding protein ZnuA
MICKFARMATLAAAIVTAGCAGSRPEPPAAAPGGAPLRVLTTISTFNSFVSGIGGERVRVDSLVPVGVSPEDYQPTPADIARLNDAQVLVENGLGLEAWLARTIENARNPQLRIVIASSGLPVKGNNPHLWMDPVLAEGYVRKIRDGLIAADPSGRDSFTAGAAQYDRRLRALEREIAARIATIPPPSRTMIVFHNAWQYYDDRFGLRTLGVVELSPGQEPNPQYLAHLVTLARANHVRAIFAEPEYSPKLVTSLAESAGIATIEDLYDDSIGTNPRVHDYESMLRYDTGVIVTALGGRP